MNLAFFTMDFLKGNDISRVEQGAELNKEDGKEMTVLHNAAKSGASMELVRYLVEQGAEVNKEVLHHAAKSGSSKDVVGYLIEQGAVVEKEDKNNLTALYHAAKQGICQVAELLLSKGGRALALLLAATTLATRCRNAALA